MSKSTDLTPGEVTSFDSLDEAAAAAGFTPTKAMIDMWRVFSETPGLTTPAVAYQLRNPEEKGMDLDVITFRVGRRIGVHGTWLVQEMGWWRTPKHMRWAVDSKRCEVHWSDDEELFEELCELAEFELPRAEYNDVYARLMGHTLPDATFNWRTTSGVSWALTERDTELQDWFIGLLKKRASK